MLETKNKSKIMKFDWIPFAMDTLQDVKIIFLVWPVEMQIKHY